MAIVRTQGNNYRKSPQLYIPDVEFDSTEVSSSNPQCTPTRIELYYVQTNYAKSGDETRIRRIEMDVYTYCFILTNNMKNTFIDRSYVVGRA